MKFHHNGKYQVLDHDTELPDKKLMRTNIPKNYTDYKNGNGEGLFYIPYQQSDDKICYDQNSNREKFQGILLGNSIYYRDILNWGTLLEFETRLDTRHVISLDMMKKLWFGDQ